jgi:hypothetical protein
MFELITAIKEGEMSQRKTCIAALSLLMVGIGVGGVPTARADFYKYKDSAGAVCITNDPNAVPPRYRASMKVVRDEALEKKDPGARKQAPQETPTASRDNAVSGVEQTPVPAVEPASRTESLTGRFPWLKPLLVVAGIGVLFLIVVKVASLLPSSQLARLIYLAFFLGVFVFGYKLYAEYMVNNYQTIKAKILAMFIKV